MAAATPTSIPQTTVLEGIHIDDGVLRTGEYCFTLLTPSTAQQGPENEMWNTYLDQVKEDDKQIADSWKEGSDGILTFIGLFSVIVAAFIIEFYKKLLPDSGERTVDLLEQISNQLSNLPNGNLSITANQPSPPRASMIWVNAMWLISLVLSLASALIATLLQQWARSYVDAPNSSGVPKQRAHVRLFLFLSTESYKMRDIVQLAFSLLHISVYLFFGGLVIVFHSIHKNVSIAVDVAVGLCGLAYIALSVLPCIDVQCPYRTPVSYILWYPLHAVVSITMLGLGWLLGKIQVRATIVTPRLRALFVWLYLYGEAGKKHWRYMKDGLGRSIIDGAVNRPENGDRKIVTRHFNLLALGDGSKLLKFAASIPRNRVLDLISPIESGRIVLREPLLILLRSCAPSTQVLSGLVEEARKRSLLVCLDAIHYIVKFPNVPDLNFVQANFADIGLMQPLWDNSDFTIRFTSRSICALLARQVFRGPLEAQRLHWLYKIIGETSDAITDADSDTRNHMNFKSFVCGVLSRQVDDLSTEDVKSFKETLAILLGNESDVAFYRGRSHDLLSAEVVWIRDRDPQGSGEVIRKLRSIFPFIPDASDAPLPHHE
ncbi:hypothetical protein BJV77DRAFT_690118 [Russula vinacea]|nr:hypothetical protein BJV77DRAFT_690118 [Russula vinacea]